MMDTENLVLKPAHDKVGALVPKEDANVATKGDIKEQKETFVLDKDFSLFLKDLWKKCEILNELEWLRIKQAMIKSRKYFDGKQYGKVNDSLEWQDFEKRPGEVNYVSNVYHAHIQTALMELSRGDTSLSFTHVAGDSRRGQLVTKIAEHRYKTHKMRLMSTLKKQQENLSLLLNGIAARYTFVQFKDGNESPMARLMELMEEEMESTVKPITICAVCAKSKSNADEICSNCGAQEVEQLEDIQPAKRLIPEMQKDRRAYSRYVTPDPIGLTFDLHATEFKDSAFVIWKQVVLTDLLKSQYPSFKIDDGIDAPELKYQYSQAAHTPNQQRLDFFLSERNSKEVSEFSQAWFDPQLYRNVSFRKDITLMSGVTIPAGTKLGEVFKRGLYVACNGKNILDVWEEDKNDKWTICPYVTRLGTLVGSGTSIAHDSQDIINDLTNLKMASILQDAFAKEFVNSQYIEPENIPNDPTERAVVTNLPDGARIVGNAIDRLPPSPLSSDAYAMDNEVQGMLQNQLGTFSSSSSGMPDLRAAQQTYSGMQLMRDITVGRFYPMLAVRADSLDKEQAYQLLLHDQKHLSMEQWAQIKGDYGAEAVKAFLQADLREELIIAVTPESFMPEMPSQKLSKSMAFAEFIANAQMDPSSEFASYIGEQFGIPRSIAGNEAVKSIAYEMINAFREQAEAIAQQLGDLPTFNIEDPMIAQIGMVIVESAQMPVTGAMYDVGAIIDTFKDWWISDEGRNSPNTLKAAIMVRTRELQAEGVKEAQLQQTYAMAAQQPMMEAQAQEAQAASAAQQEAMMLEGAKQVATDEARLELEKQRLGVEQERMERSEMENDKKRQHELMVKSMESAKESQSQQPGD
jgi:hypothetical protein